MQLSPLNVSFDSWISHAKDTYLFQTLQISFRYGLEPSFFFSLYVTWLRGMNQMSKILILNKTLKNVTNSYFTLFLDSKEMSISLQPDARLRWGLDHNILLKSCYRKYVWLGDLTIPEKYNLKLHWKHWLDFFSIKKSDRVTLSHWQVFSKQQ